MNNEQVRYRAVFMSDLHLGASECRADEAADFLKMVRCDTLYLVGDILDMWLLKKSWHWPDSHNRVVRRVLKLAKKGTRVVYIPGNHDEAARDYAGLNFAGVELVRRCVHTTSDGRTLLVIHGDEFDLVVKHAPLISALGGAAYDLLLVLNRHLNRCRGLLGLEYWSLAKSIKLKVKSACTFISRFEEAVIDEARRLGHAGVVCGHIHHGECRTIAGKNADEHPLLYLNCGEWVEGGTAIVEHDDGRLELIDAWAMVRAWRAQRAIVEPDDAHEPLDAGLFGDMPAPMPAALGWSPA